MPLIQAMRRADASPPTPASQIRRARRRIARRRRTMRLAIVYRRTWWPAACSTPEASSSRSAGTRTRLPSKPETTTRHASGPKRRHDRAQHPGRLHVMRLVAVPQRRPCILARVVAPHHCGSVRAEHDGEHVRAQINVGDVCRAIKNVRTVEHPQRLMAGGGHRQIIACKCMPGPAPRSLGARPFSSDEFRGGPRSVPRTAPPQE